MAIVSSSISLLKVSGFRSLHMFCRRPSGLVSSLRHLLASLSCVSLSSTQNRLFPFFGGSMRKSRKNRCKSLTGKSSLSGILRTECSESSLHLTSSLEIWKKCASDEIERGLSKTTILPTMSRNSLVLLCLSSSSSSSKSWLRMGRYVLSSLETWIAD